MFGPDVGSLKGMKTRNLPMLVMSNYIRVPKELVKTHNGVTLCIDTIQINGLVFCTSLSRQVMHWIIVFIQDQGVQRYKVYCIRSSGFTIKLASETWL